MVQAFKAEVVIEDGKDLVKVTTLQPSASKLLRLYSTCCSSPLFNTWNTGLATIGIFAEALVDPGQKVAAFGPLFARLNGRYATRPLPRDLIPPAAPGFGCGFLSRFVLRNLLNWAKAKPWPVDLNVQPIIRE